MVGLSVELETFCPPTTHSGPRTKLHKVNFAPSMVSGPVSVKSFG